MQNYYKKIIIFEINYFNIEEKIDINFHYLINIH